MKTKEAYDNIKYLKNASLSRADSVYANNLAIKRIKTLTPIGDQFIYAYSYLTHQYIFTSKSIFNVLGYTNDEMSNDLLYDIIHPEDREQVLEATQKAIFAGEKKYNHNPLSVIFHICYRLRKKNGDYIHIQRQSGILTQNTKGDMTSSFGIITNISHISKKEEVSLKITGADNYVFSNKPSVLWNRFSNREKEILNLLCEGMASKSIADKLNISTNTVDTHRRNLLKKTKFKNTNELVAFVSKTLP